MFCAVIEALLQAKYVAEVCVEWGDREGGKGRERRGEVASSHGQLSKLTLIKTL